MPSDHACPTADFQAPDTDCTDAKEKQELPSEDLKEGPFQEDQSPPDGKFGPHGHCSPASQMSLSSERMSSRSTRMPGSLPDAVRDAEGRPVSPVLPYFKATAPGTRVWALQCNVSVEDSHQERTFTLYDFDTSGKVTREDMSSLIHTIYEVVDASMNHSSGSSKTLCVKLTVSPEPVGTRKECPPASLDREPTRSRTEGHPQAGPAGAPQQGCTPPQPSHSQKPDSHAAHHRRSQVLGDHTALATEPAARGLDSQPRLKGPEKAFLRSPKGPGQPPGAVGSGKPGRAKGREGRSSLKATHSQPAVAEHQVVRDLLPVLGAEGCAVPVVQWHEHHHEPPS
ncbi:naked cuticle-like protein 2 [Heterocephalus glaber]|uniref:Protein naked cuticle homolog n=1 Tax=Heterocephalus glaber TaxID=10181 RepID=G5BPH8_HETGA|nr:naked cuticle-like protein 2 [Heterocephalus glaber]